MILLLTHIWGWLLIAWLLGMIIGGILMWPRRSMRLKEVEQDLRVSREHGIELDKEVKELRHKLGELEGVPEAERRARIASRDELVKRITSLEATVSAARSDERRAKDEADELRREVRNLSSQLTEERNKPAPVLELTPAFAATAGQDDAIAALQARLDDALFTADQRTHESAGLKTKLFELEGQVARALDGARETEAFRNRVLELEAQLRQEAQGSSDRYVALSARNQELEAKLKEREAIPAAPLIDSGEIAALRRDAAQLPGLQARTSELEGLLAQAQGAQATVAALQQQVARLQSDAANAGADRQTLEGLQQQVAALQGQLGTERAHAQVEAEQLRHQTQAAQADAQGWTARATQAEAELGPLRAAAAEVAALQARIATQEADIDYLRSGAAEAEGLRVRLSAAENELTTLRQSTDPAVLNARIAETEARLHEAQAGLGGLHATIAERDHLRTLLAEAEARAASQSVDPESLRLAQVRAAELEARVNDLTAQSHAAAQASADVAPLRARVADLERRLGEAQRSQDEAAILRAQVAEMNGRLGQALRAAAEADGLRIKLAALEAKLV
jgi:DNA repair exonuclease SbcCD ATPase subunit